MVIDSTPTTNVPDAAVFTTFGPAAQVTKFSSAPAPAKRESSSSVRRLPASPHHLIPGLVGCLLRRVATN